MKSWPIAVTGLVLLAAAGCRMDPAIPILERELRLKEDEIYRLRACVEQMQDSCTYETIASSERPRSDSTSPRRSDSGASNGKPPAVELPSRPASEVPDALKHPAGGLPSDVPDVPEHLRGPAPKSSADRGAEGPSLDRAAGEPLMPSGDSRQVAAIVLNRALCGGINEGGQEGDQGLLVVVEPRDRSGRTLDAPANVSVVVLDPALPGEEARVARWDFSAAETAAMFRRTGADRAIHLTMAWPGDPPRHNNLRLFVRYETADGRKLQTDAPIEVALAGERSDRSAPQMATRDDQPGPQNAPKRPVWSPDRR